MIKKLCKYTCMEIQQVFKDSWLVLATGSIEQHSANLPLSVDMDISGAIAAKVCEAENMLLAPPLIYGVRSLPNSGGGNEFPGTIFVRGEIYTAYIEDILKGYFENGVEKMLIINGHYENYAFLCEAVELLKPDDRYKVIIMNWWDVLEDSFMDKVTDGRFCGWTLEHAGIVETAIECYLKPELVKDITYFEEQNKYRNIFSTGINWMRSRTGALSSNIGATSEMGEKIFMKIIHEIKILIETIERR